MRVAIATALAALVVAVAAGCGGGGGSAGGDTTAGSGESVSPSSISTYAGIQTETAQVYQEWLNGIGIVNKSAGSPEAKALVDGYDPQKQLQLFTPVFSTGCDRCVMSILPISPSNAKPLVTQAERANSFLSLAYLNIPGYNPWDAGSNFVSFISFNGEQVGYETGKALLESMGGKGNVIEIDGTPGPGPAGGDALSNGFKKALEEFPEVHVLAAESAEWQQEVAREITETLLTKYGSQIGGVWAANDASALGVVQALKTKNLAGKVPVSGTNGAPEALELIKSGEMVATQFESGALVGAVSTALAHAAAVGDIDPEQLSHAQRKFYLVSSLVTKDNVDEYLNPESNPLFDSSELAYPALKKNFWKFSAGAMSPSE